MKVLRLDMSGSHMSHVFREWAGGQGIRLDMIPKDAHHRLGILERNHQVRREQLEIYHAAHPKDSLRKAVRITCPQRNRLRNVRGFTPAQRVLGVLPRLPGTLAEEEFRLAEQSQATDARTEFAETLARQASAGAAFLKANVSTAVRAALLARSRPMRRRFAVGEWVY